MCVIPRDSYCDYRCAGKKAVVPWRLSWIGRLIAWYGYENTAFALLEENASAVQLH